MEQPAWVSEGSVRKFHRAVAELVKEKKEVTEEAVKTLYVKWGGLLVGEEVATEEEAPKAKKAKKADAAE